MNPVRRVALVSPAGAVKEELVTVAIEQLQAAGIEAVLGEQALKRHRYLAGTAEERAADLHWAFSQADVDAVWCLRGGYGSAQLLPWLDWSRLSSSKGRPLIGYSDLTVLLEAFHRRGLTAIHGPGALDWGRRDEDPATQAARTRSLESVLELCAGSRPAWQLERLAGPAQVPAGELIGGNLTTLASVVGTAAALRPHDGAILMLEDVGEPYYRLERSLCQLLGNLTEHRIGAVCLGTFTDCPPRNVEQSLEEIFAEWLAPRGIALYRGLPSGHGPENQAWPYGARVRLEAGRLQVL